VIDEMYHLMIMCIVCIVLNYNVQGMAYQVRLYANRLLVVACGGVVLDRYPELSWCTNRGLGVELAEIYISLVIK